MSTNKKFKKILLKAILLFILPLSILSCSGTLFESIINTSSEIQDTTKKKITESRLELKRETLSTILECWH